MVDMAPVSLREITLSIERPALYVVATPIGNRADLSARAIGTLSAVDFVLAEDPRHSRNLLEYYRIEAEMLAFHQHNEAHGAAAIIERLLQDTAACALISDAGTPLISDPGYGLVQAADEGSVPVIAVPGPCAAIAALSIAGLSTERFAFEGFLPPRQSAREKRLATLARERRTLVFYEAPHRLLQTLQAMASMLGGDRAAVVARELTKVHESVYRGTLTELANLAVADENLQRGELVIVVAGSAEEPAAAEARRVLKLLLTVTDNKTAIRLTREITGVSRNQLYAMALNETAGGPKDIEK